MSSEEMWTWKADTPGRVPAGARISAGKSGSVARSLPASALTAVNWLPVSCIPSPESPARRITTSVICSEGLFAPPPLVVCSGTPHPLVCRSGALTLFPRPYPSTVGHDEPPRRRVGISPARAPDDVPPALLPARFAAPPNRRRAGVGTRAARERRGRAVLGEAVAGVDHGAHLDHRGRLAVAIGQHGGGLLHRVEGATPVQVHPRVGQARVGGTEIAARASSAPTIQSGVARWTS